MWMVPAAVRREVCFPCVFEGRKECHESLSPDEPFDNKDSNGIEITDTLFVGELTEVHCLPWL